MQLIDTFSAAGGTSTIDLRGPSDGGTAYDTGTLEGDLVQALTAIATSSVSCEVSIPDASTVDPAAIEVIYTPTSGPDRLLTKVLDNDPANCGMGDSYYLLPDDANPTEIVMCDTICDTVRADVGSDVAISGGCVGGFSASTTVHDYSGDCSGTPGKTAIWELLAYDATIPPGATVRFGISTSNVDAATAANGPFTTIATADAANPDALLSVSPVDLQATLGALAQQQFLAIEISLTPNATGTATPTLHHWNVRYSCEDNL